MDIKMIKHKIAAHIFQETISTIIEFFSELCVPRWFSALPIPSPKRFTHGDEDTLARTGGWTSHGIRRGIPWGIFGWFLVPKKAGFFSPMDGLIRTFRMFDMSEFFFQFMVILLPSFWPITMAGSRSSVGVKRILRKLTGWGSSGFQWIRDVGRYTKIYHSCDGHESVPTNTIFTWMHLLKSQLFWCEQKGNKRFWPILRYETCFFSPSFPRKRIHMYSWNSCSAHLSSFFNRIKERGTLPTATSTWRSRSSLCWPCLARRHLWLNWNDLSDFFGNQQNFPDFLQNHRISYMYMYI